MSGQDMRTHDELVRAVTLAGWNEIHRNYGSDGIAVTFEKVSQENEFDMRRVETRTVHGADDDDVMRKLLADLAEQDERTEDELHHEVLMADWNIGEYAYGAAGVTLTFRKHYTSDAPGVEKRQVHGKDRADAVRKFLAELAEQEAS